MFDSILVVCTGNICRSPTGERLLRQLMPNKKIDSAGTFGLMGKAADQTAVDVAQAHGISLKDHIAQRFTAVLARQYDLILVMEIEHIKQVTAIAPEARGKTMLFNQWPEKKEIPDPYHKNREVFEQVYFLLEQASKEWAKKLQK